MRTLKQFYFFTLLYFLLPIASATGIEIHESKDLDFNGCQLYHLESGLNVLSGTETSEDPSDGFRFVVPKGHAAKIDVEYRISQSEGASLVWELEALLEAKECESSDTFGFLKYLNGGILASEIFEDPVGFTVPSSWEFTPIQGAELGEGAYIIYNNFSFGLVDQTLFEYTFSIEIKDSKSSGAGSTNIVFLMLMTVILVFRLSQYALIKCLNSKDKRQ